MTRHLLLLSVIIGTLYTLPALASETSPDYENVYDDEDASRSPGNLAKSTAAPMVPYFEQDEGIVYALPNATHVKLDCPVKNYDAVRHVILWYRDKTLVMNGNTPVINIYSLDNQFVLNAPLANATGHSFSCHVMPANVKHMISIKLGAPPATQMPASSNSSSASSISWPTAVECAILGALSLIARF